MFDISGKVAVVTGASGVLGESIAESLMHAGVSVVVLGKTESRINARVKQLSEIHENVMGAVHFPCSDAASFITGAIIPIDGDFSSFNYLYFSFA